MNTKIKIALEHDDTTQDSNSRDSRRLNLEYSVTGGDLGNLNTSFQYNHFEKITFGLKKDHVFNKDFFGEILPMLAADKDKIVGVMVNLYLATVSSGEPIPAQFELIRKDGSSEFSMGLMSNFMMLNISNFDFEFSIRNIQTVEPNQVYNLDFVIFIKDRDIQP